MKPKDFSIQFAASYKVFEGNYSRKKKTSLRAINQDDALKEAYINAIIDNASSTIVDLGYLGIKERKKLSDQSFENLSLDQIVEYYENNKLDNCEKNIVEFRGLYKQRYFFTCPQCGLLSKTKTKCESCGETVEKFTSDALIEIET